MTEANNSPLNEADYWNSVQQAAQQEVVRKAAQLFRAKIVSYNGFKANIRRDYAETPDGIFYPVVGASRPPVGSWVWCLQKFGGVLVLGAEVRADWFTNLHVRSAGPLIRMEDNDRTGAGENYWLHSNEGIFYILQDRNGDGMWDSPHPLYVTTDGRVNVGFAPTTASHVVNRGFADDSYLPVAPVYAESFLVGGNNTEVRTHGLGRLPHIVTGFMRESGTNNNWRVMPTSPGDSGIDVYITEVGSSTYSVRNRALSITWQVLIKMY